MYLIAPCFYFQCNPYKPHNDYNQFHELFVLIHDALQLRPLLHVVSTAAITGTGTAQLLHLEVSITGLNIAYFDINPNTHGQMVLQYVRPLRPRQNEKDNRVTTAIISVERLFIHAHLPHKKA